MLTNHCPACWRANADDATSCSVCGAHLGAVDTVRLPLRSSVGPASGGALWLDDLVGPAVEPSPDADPDAPPLELTLRDIDASAPPAPPVRPVLPNESRLPASALVQSDGAPPWPVIDVAAPSTPHQTADAAQRAERRAAVRRGRRVGASASSDLANSAAAVLVVGPTDTADDPLCSLLQGFGFTVHATADSAEALAHAASPTVLASFVRAELPDGIDLCGKLRQASAQGGERAVLLVLVAARLRPMDRVRAELAGCDAAIAAPLTRGSVARLLDARGIRLPSDPRRA